MPVCNAPPRLTDRQLAAYINRLGDEPWTEPGPVCWQLTRKVQRDIMHRDLPVIIDHDPGLIAKIRLALRHEERNLWRMVAEPEYGCLVAMDRIADQKAPPALASRIEHYGVYFPIDRGGILHIESREAGVTFQRLLLARAVNRWQFSFWVPR